MCDRMAVGAERHEIALGVNYIVFPETRHGNDMVNLNKPSSGLAVELSHIQTTSLAG